MLNCHVGSCINNKNKECSLKDITIDGLLKCKDYEFDMAKVIKTEKESKDDE